jgi:opacity protein-like surface antigen
VNVIHRYVVSAALASAGILMPLAAVSAQQPAPVRSNTEKLMLSFALGGASIDSDELEAERESGGGFSLQLGWGFNRLFTLLVDASGAVLGDDEDEFVLLHGDLLGRFHFTGPQRAWVPFLEGGITGRVAGQDDIIIIDDNGNPQQVDLEVSGGGFTFGGGLQYHVSPAVALGASLRWTVGEFSTVKFNNVSIDGFELDATSARLNLGVTWRPLR